MAGSTSSFGASISSIPNTSYLNVSSPISSASPSVRSAYQEAISKPTGAGMDPFSIGLGVASIGASIFGASAQQKAAEQSAKATEEAARIAAASTQKAAEAGGATQIAGKLGGFGIDYLTQRYNTGAGGFANRWNALQDAGQDAMFQANNPDMISLRSVQRYRDRLEGAMPGYMPPSNLFA
jgi:hypothetical protein